MVTICPSSFYLQSSCIIDQHAPVLQERADRFGILASALCAVHCAAGAILAGATGIGSLLADERLEATFVCVALLIAFGALSLGFKKHRRAGAVTLGVVALSVLGVTRFVRFSAGTSERALSIFGAALLVAAHALNLRSLRQHEACRCAACEIALPSTEAATEASQS
jgi:hypothetical protein